jgi:hypothetical protein
MDDESIVIARELRALTEAPGWKHLAALMEGIIENQIVGPKELAQLSAELIAYRIGFKDGIAQLKKGIELNIHTGRQAAKEVIDNKKRQIRRVADLNEMKNRHGY